MPGIRIIPSISKLFTIIILFSGIVRAQEQRPNVIFILTDDQRWDAMGYPHNSIIQTPNMDQLAREGVYFENSFVTTPICAASRASIMTGMYERSHHFTFGTPPLSEELVDITYPQLLKDNGYKTGFIGKFGMRYENKLDTTMFDYYRRPGEQFWATTYYRLTADHTGHKHLTTELGNLSIDFLDKFSGDEPFCLSLSFHAPHAEDVDPRQYIYPLELDSLYANIDIPDPELLDQYYYEQQPQWVKDGLSKVRWYWRFNTPEKYQEMVKGYYRMISGIDIQLGRIRAKLEELGIADNTIIIFMGDNGYFLGERQLAGKWLMYDNSLRVPLMIYDPRQAHGMHNSELALNIDIAPTILTYAGIAIPPEIQGAPLQKAIDIDPNWRKAFLTEHLMETPKIPKSEGIRTKEWKYFRYVDHPEWEELYHLVIDPSESNNLAKDESYQSKLDEMRAQLDDMIKVSE